LKNLDDSVLKRQRNYDAKVSDAERNALAMRYVEADRPVEALELLERTRDRDGLLRVRAWAVERGDAFVVTQTERFLRDQATADEWRRTAEKAFAAGRWHHAKTAWERAGDEAAAARAAEKLPEPPPIGPGRRLLLKQERDEEAPAR